MNPLKALKIVERILRNTEAYHIAMDKKATIGLGEWIKRVIKENKTPNPFLKIRGLTPDDRYDG